VDVNKNVTKFYKGSSIHFSPVPLEQAQFKNNFFDVIIMNDVIEHLHNIHSLLHKVHKLLKPGGILFLVTPDVGSFTRKILRKHWHHFKPYEHLVYFSRFTLRSLLQPCGFDIIDMHHISRHRMIKTILEKAPSFFGIDTLLLNIFPQRLLHIILPFNFYDELCVLARKA